MPLSSTTQIANMALSLLGISKSIANLDNENSAEAKACRIFYENTRDTVLSDFPWPFAGKFADLALVETSPNDEWGYSYRYPTDALQIRRILSGIRNDNQDSRVVYKIASDDSGLLIFTDQVDAQIEYTKLITAVEFYPQVFVRAMAYHLAAAIAPRLTAGDPFKREQRCYQLYQATLEAAQAKVLDEEQPDNPPESEFIRGRD